MNSKQTSQKMAATASNVLRSNSSSNIQTGLAASALSQANPNKQTGAAMETKASNVLKSDKYNEVTKGLAASVLSQSNKAR